MPRPKDIKAGFLPRSISISDDATDEQTAKLCQKYQEELLRWRETGTTKIPLTRGSWAYVIKEYKTNEISPYQALGPRTKSDYDIYMEKIKTRIGKRRVSSTEASDLWRWYKKFAKCPDTMTIEQAKADGLELALIQAKKHMDMIRRLARMAVLMKVPGALGIEPLFTALRGRMVGARPRTNYTTVGDVQEFLKAADDNERWSLGTATLMQFELAQRQGDIIGRWIDCAPRSQGGIVHLAKRWVDGVQWSDIDAEWNLTIVQNKRKGKVIIESDLTKHPELLERLKTVPKDQRFGPIIKSEITGLPYRADNFRARFRNIADKAGWPKDLWSMDNRAGAATEASDAGATTKDIQSITGHSNEQSASRYSRTSKAKANKVVELRRKHREND